MRSKKRKTVSYRQQRRIAKQWAKGEQLVVLFAQYGLDHTSFAALLREVGAREPTILLPVSTDAWAQVQEP